MNKGFSLIELLIVVGVFSVLGVVVSQAIVSSVRTAKKADTSVEVRETVSFALETIERKALNATDVPSCQSADTSFLYISGSEEDSIYECVDNHLRENGARITNDTTRLTKCELICSVDASGAPTITVNLDGESINDGIDGAQVSLSKKIRPRSN